jgi:hypothetical protein
MRTPSLFACLLFLIPSAPSAHAGGDEGRLERALATIEAGEIRADLFFFASQEMRGRDTPSKEQRVAARFLRARLERLGFAPGAGASYFYEYPLQRRRIDVERTHLVFQEPKTAAAAGPEPSKEEWHPKELARFVFGQDYYFPSSRDIAALERQGPATFCGKGEREDFERVDVKGRWAVCLASELSTRRRARYAQGAGAVGLLVLPDPAGSADPAAKECARTTEYALEGLSDITPGNDSSEFLPQISFGLAGARRLVEVGVLSSPLPALGTQLQVEILDTRAGSGPIALENVCAVWPGNDPVLGKEVVIVSAHYDHEGVHAGKVYPGADDNGSGSMGLLALAEALAEYGPLRRTVLLMWVSGEEKGLWGSAAWTKRPILPEGARAVCDLNIDMIGRNAPDYLLITPTKRLPHYNGLTRLAEELAPREGFATLGSADEYWERSDHRNFAVNLKIPVAFLFSDVHADYHQPTDTPDKIDYDKIRRVTRLVMRMLERLQVDKLEL